MNPEEPPVLGREIPWTDVRGKAMRVIDASLLAVTREGKDLLGRVNLDQLSTKLPYALLQVELAEERRPANWATGPAIFPVYHREDFRAVEHALGMENLEVVVFHAPIRFPWYVRLFKNAMPTMIVWACDRGALNEMLHPEMRTGDFFETLSKIRWTYEPLLQRFQGRWEYEP